MAKRVTKKYFSPYSKPIKPTPPPKTISGNVFLGEKICYSEDVLLISDIPEGCEYLDIDVYTTSATHDYTYKEKITKVRIKFYTAKDVDNPNYEKQYQEYKEELESYKVELAEWKAQKVIYDQEQKDSRRRQYEKLKEEFENS